VPRPIQENPTYELSGGATCTMGWGTAFARVPPMRIDRSVQCRHA